MQAKRTSPAAEATPSTTRTPSTMAPWLVPETCVSESRIGDQSGMPLATAATATVKPTAK